MLVSCPGKKFQNLSTTVVPVQSHLARSVSSQKALDMSQLWKVFLRHDTMSGNNKTSKTRITPLLKANAAKQESQLLVPGLCSF